MGDELVVALTLDEFVGKGAGRPIQTWAYRAGMLESLRYVDRVVPSRNLAAAILSQRPNIVAKGVDYAESGLLPEEIAAASAVGAEIRFTRSEKYSTTKMIERIRCGSA